MAKGQLQGLNAITLWMIVFVALWLTSTVFLVILYTGQEDLNVNNARLQAANNKLISPQEEKSIELVRSAQEGGPTVVGLLEDARKQTARLTTGEETDNPGAIRSKRDQVLRNVRDEGLVPKPDAYQDISYHEALTRLYEVYKGELDSRRNAEERETDLKAQTAAVIEAGSRQKDDFDKRSKETAQQLSQCEADRAAYRAERDKAVEKLERDFEDSRAKNTEDLTKERQRRQAAEQRLVEFQKRFAAQQEKMGGLAIGPEKLATARQPDGRILTAVPGDDVVYIDLGREDALTLGLQFAVYSATTGIPEDGRGKAQIEVVSISPSSAECKIVSLRGNEVILQGDWIANPIYDRDRPLSFLVLGEFDLNRDGIMDRDGAATLESLVKNWGGKVETELTPLTDFVVLGIAPRRAKPAAESAPGSSTQWSTGGSKPSVWDRYQETVENAKSLSVPVMSQDVFLNFLGYADRYARR